MTAFILSSAIAFGLYELLLLMKWPPSTRTFNFYQGRIVLSAAAARIAPTFVRSATVVAILLLVLTIHNFTLPVDKVATYEVNIVFGFVFGPLFAIWVNGIVLHTANKELSRGQILAAVGLAALFIFGMIGNEAEKMVRRYSNRLSSVKVAGTELSFTSNSRDRSDRITSTAQLTTAQQTTGRFAANGLANLAFLGVTIERDRAYVAEAFAPGSADAVADLNDAAAFAQQSIVLPMSCLFSWYQQTGDSRTLEKHLIAYGDAFRQLEALNAQMSSNQPNSSLQRVPEERLREVVADFVHHGLTVALEIAQSTATPDALPQCTKWYEVYCRAADKPASGDQPNGSMMAPQCLRKALQQFTRSDASKADDVENRVASLAGMLAEFIVPQGSNDTRGLRATPYFAIAQASLMAQLDQHEAAAAILDAWLRGRSDANSQAQRREELDRHPALKIRDDWLALRLRSIMVVYVEDWLEDPKAKAATVVQTEHLKNLRVTIDGFKSRLLKADFFKRLDQACQTKCEPAFKRPTECNSDEPNARLKLWQRLYTSYITMQYTYIHRALQHPDYLTKYAETVNDKARRLVNYDASCVSPDLGRPEEFYGQSLLAFVENAVAYTKVRAGGDSEDVQRQRLDEAEQAAKLGLEIVEEAVTDDQERDGKPFLERISPSFAIQVQEDLKAQLKNIEQIRKDMSD